MSCFGIIVFYCSSIELVYYMLVWFFGFVFCTCVNIYVLEKKPIQQQHILEEKKKKVKLLLLKSNQWMMLKSRRIITNMQS